MAYRLGQPLEYDPFGDQEDVVDTPTRFSVGEALEIDPFEYQNEPQASDLEEPDAEGHSLWDIPRMMGKGAAAVGRTAGLLNTLINPVESGARIAGVIGDLTENEALQANRDYFVKHGGSAKLEQWGKTAEEYYDDRLTPAMKRSMEKTLLASAEEEGFLGEGATDPWKIGGMIAESIPSTVISMGAGALITKGLIQTGMKTAPKIVQGVIQRQIEKHGINAVAGVVGGAAGEGGYSGLENARSAFDEMMNTPQGELAKSPTYQELYNSMPAKFTPEQKHAYARKTLAMATAGFIGSITAVTTGILGAPSGAFMGKLIGGEGGKSFWGNLLKGAMLEGFAEEMPQSGIERLVENTTKRFLVDPNQAITEGVGEAMAGGAVTGFAMGGGLAVVAGREGKAPSDAKKILTGGTDQTAKDILLPKTEAEKIRERTQGKDYRGPESLEAEEEAAEIPEEDLKKIPTPAIQKEAPSDRKGEKPVPSEKPQGQKPVKAPELPKGQAAPAPGGVVQKPKQDEAPEVERRAKPERPAWDDHFRALVGEAKSQKPEVFAETAAKRVKAGDPAILDLARRMGKRIELDTKLDDALKTVHARIQAGMEPRKRTQEMSEKELKEAITTDYLTGLKSKHAFDIEDDRKKHVASIDLDSLKYFNDAFGHQTGDEMLINFGNALKNIGADAYHISGDEYVIQHDDEAELKRIIDEDVIKNLKAQPITVTLPDGKKINYEVQFSYGTGQTISESEEALAAHKALRESTGLRSGRGEVPRGILENIAEGRPPGSERQELPEKDVKPKKPPARVSPPAARPAAPETPAEKIPENVPGALEGLWRDLRSKGAGRVGNTDYKILTTDDGGYYYTKTEGGVRYESGPGYPAKWSRDTAIDKALKEAEGQLEPAAAPETPAEKIPKDFQKRLSVLRSRLKRAEEVGVDFSYFKKQVDRYANLENVDPAKILNAINSRIADAEKKPAKEPEPKKAPEKAPEKEPYWSSGHLQKPDRPHQWWTDLFRARVVLNDIVKETGAEEWAQGIDTNSLDAIVAAIDSVDNIALDKKPAAGPPPHVVEFSSGSSKISDIKAHTAAGVDIGVVAGDTSMAGLKALAEHAQAGYRVYMDSGAFSAFTRNKPVNWDKVFGHYDKLVHWTGEEHAGNLYLTAPDVVGDQEATMALIEDNAERVTDLMNRGANIMVPMQKGEIAPSDFYEQLTKILESDFIPAVPSNKVAFSPEDLTDLLKFSEAFPAIHLLGISKRNKKFPALRKTIQAAAPNLPISVDASTIIKGVMSNADYQRKMADLGSEGPYAAAPAEAEEYGQINPIDSQWIKRAGRVLKIDVDNGMIAIIQGGGLESALKESRFSGEGLEAEFEQAYEVYQYAVRLEAAQAATRKEKVEHRLKTEKPIAGIPAIEAKKGKEVQIITAGNRRGYGSYYALVDAGDVVPSHSPQTFQKNPDYPEGIQERTYHSDKREQEKVILNAQNLSPEILLSDDPTPTNGPPIVTDSGIALGGNSRAMSIQRAYEGPMGKLYKNQILSKSLLFGFRPEDVKAMDKPMVVRVVYLPKDDIKTLHRMASEFNKALTQGMSQEAEIASMGKNISIETIEKVGLRMANRDLTLRELLGRKDGMEILRWLIADNVISAADENRFVASQVGLLNDSGKNIIEKAFFGSIIDDADLISAAPKNYLNKLGRALPSLARLKARGDQWDITPQIKNALELATASKAADLSIKDHLAQGSLFAGDKKTYTDIERALAFRIRSDTQTLFARAIKNFSADAMADVKDQTFLFEPKKFEDAFKEAFDAEVKEPPPTPAKSVAELVLLAPDEYITYLQKRARPPFLEDSGIDFAETVEIEETGETIERMIDAPGYLNDIDEQIQSFDELLKCMAGRSL